MKHKFIIAIMFTAIVFIVAGLGAQPEEQSQTSKEAKISAPIDSTRIDTNDSTKTEPEVIAYYFHTTVRCVSCKKIEAYSREAIENGFAEELKNGTLKFESINIDDEDNKHFAKDYQLYTKSLIICDMESGKQVQWKNLEKVWQLLGNEEKFIKYVRDEINSYLKES